METVKQIIDPAYKTGEKNGKQWTIKKISLESGKEATTFDEVEPGDEVKVVYDDQYNQYKASKPRVTDIQHDEVMKVLKAMFKMQKEIYTVVTGKELSKPEPKPAPKPEPRDDEEITLDSIPF